MAVGIPKVSILIPAYNSAQFIADAIHSALDQSWPNKEIIIVDDGSNDETWDIANSYRDCCVKVFRQQRGGACKARNLAFRESTGDFIQYLDADDVLSPDKIQNQIQLGLKPDIDSLASCPWAKFSKEINNIQFENQYVFKDYEIPHKLIMDLWEKREMMSISVWLTPRKLIEAAGPWNEMLTINQDGEFFCRVLLKANSVMFSSDAKVYYRTNITNSITGSKITYEKAASLLNSYDLYYKSFSEHNLLESGRMGLALNYFEFIYQYFGFYPDLVLLAREKVKSLGVIPSRTYLGGTKFKKISGLLGFYNALRLRTVLTKLNIW